MPEIFQNFKKVDEVLINVNVGILDSVLKRFKDSHKMKI